MGLAERIIDDTYVLSSFFQEERKKSMDREMGLEGSKEESDAAKLIQNKFRNLKIKKKTPTNDSPSTGDNKKLEDVKENPTVGGTDSGELK